MYALAWHELELKLATAGDAERGDLAQGMTRVNDLTAPGKVESSSSPSFAELRIRSIEADRNLSARALERNVVRPQAGRQQPYLTFSRHKTPSA